MTVVTPDPASETRVEHIEFFVSYTKPDEHWAAWIAWQLEARRHTDIRSDDMKSLACCWVAKESVMPAT
jgi:hypothetical protein